MWSDRTVSPVEAPSNGDRTPTPLPRRTVLAGALLAGALASACTVAPVHGTRLGSAPLGLVRVAEVDTRVAQRVRNGLIETLGRPTAPRPFVMTIEVDNAVRLFLNDFETDRASAGTVTVEVAYVLTAPDGTITRGRERARASFDAPLQEFARQRAIRDAENRAAREAAQRVRLAVAPVLTGRGAALAPVGSRELGPERDPQ